MDLVFFLGTLYMRICFLLIKRHLATKVLNTVQKYSPLCLNNGWNVIDVAWKFAVKLAPPGKVTRRAYKVFGWNL
jgi:hypothetical protein